MVSFNLSVLTTAVSLAMATALLLWFRETGREHDASPRPGKWTCLLLWAGASLLAVGGLYGMTQPLHEKVTAAEAQARLAYLMQEPLQFLTVRVEGNDALAENREKTALRLHITTRGGAAFVSDVPAERLAAPVSFGQYSPLGGFGNAHTVPWTVVLSGITDSPAQAVGADLKLLGDFRGVERLDLELEVRGGPRVKFPNRIGVLLNQHESLAVFTADHDPASATKGDKVVAVYQDLTALPERIKAIEETLTPKPRSLGAEWRWPLLVGWLLLGLGLAGFLPDVRFGAAAPQPGGADAAEPDEARAGAGAGGVWERLGRDLGWGEVAWFLGWAVLSSVWCLTAARELSATYDEPTYLDAALERWSTGSHAYVSEFGTPPLPVDVSYLPVYLLQRFRGEPLEWPTNLRLARASALVFWWVLLFYAWRAGRRLGGPWAGRMAVAWTACEPNLLANATLAATDVPFTACMAGLAYHYWDGRDAGWVRRVLLPGLWLALALLAKASAVLFAPLCFIAVEVERLARAGLLRAQTFSRDRALLWFQSLPGDMLQIVTLGLAVAAAYCLEVFPGIWKQVERTGGTTDAFILGRLHPTSPWYYFPVALSIKLPTALLLLPALVAALRPRALANWPLIAAVLLLLYTPFCTVPLGVRYFLPLVVFAIVGLSAALAEGWRQDRGRWWRPALPTAGVVCVAWTAAASAWVWPHGLSYVNELWGGPSNGYRLVSDANYNWGQGVQDIARWQQANPHRTPLAIWYYGVDPTIHNVPAKIFGLETIQDPEEVRALVRGHYLAVSTTWVVGGSGGQGLGREAASILSDREPIDRTLLFLIYDFTQD